MRMGVQRHRSMGRAAGWAAVAGGAMAALMGAAGAQEPTFGEGPVTYTEHIAPIIQERCQSCHRPGSVGPFSLMNYRQVRCWANLIFNEVENGDMPPWHADPNVGDFKNDRSLTAAEKEAFRRWKEGGMPQGDPADLPPPKDWTEGWRIGEPDLIFQLPEEVSIQPHGVVPYMWFRTPTGFEEDRWVRKMEIRPGTPDVVHHVLIYVVDSENGEARGFSKVFQGLGRGFLAGYAPGTDVTTFGGETAMRIPAGSDLVWQVHYTPTGRTETDRTEFGLVFAEDPPKHELFTGSVQNTGFAIPPHAERHAVTAETTFPVDAFLVAMTPYMRHRGEAFTYTAVYPDGREELLLRVPEYDFHWQTTYELAVPKAMPEGTTLRCTAYYDNSAGNPHNPDPDKTVRWGEQTWEEMMIGWFQFFPADGNAPASDE